jgi:DNA-binding GntR family transcriptional regulator
MSPQVRPTGTERHAEPPDKPSVLTSAFSTRHDRAKVTDWVFDELKAAIIDLRLPPGEPLREAALAESLGVSKTPIREALSRLEQEGLVQSTSFKGAVVGEYTRNDLIEIYELRDMLESWAVREAATSMDEDQLSRLDVLIAEGELLRSQGEMEALSEAIDEFDRFVFAQVTNQRIAALIDNLRAHLTRIGHLTAEIPGRLQTSVDEHAAIAHALRSRDPGAAAAALRGHIMSVRDDQLRSLDARSDLL